MRKTTAIIILLNCLLLKPGISSALPPNLENMMQDMLQKIEPEISIKAAAGTTQVVTVGFDENCDFNSIQMAIDSVPSNNADLEVRISNESTFQENLLIMAQGLILKGSYHNCTDALNDISTDISSVIMSSGNDQAVVKITNPHGLSNREIVIEKIAIVDGNTTAASESEGGGIASHFAHANIYLNHVHISNNQAQLGGGIFTKGSHTNIYLNEFFLANNSAANGGGLYCDGSNVLMYGFYSYISFNDAILAADLNNGHGGGVYATNSCAFSTFSGTGYISTFDFRGITSNGANNHGGGIYADNGSTILLYGHDFGNGIGNELEPTNLSANLADVDDNGTGNGGGIYAVGQETHVSAYAAVIEYNAAKRGGAVYLENATFTMGRENDACWSRLQCSKIERNVSNHGKDTVVASSTDGSGMLRIFQTLIKKNIANNHNFLWVENMPVELESNIIINNGKSGEGQNLIGLSGTQPFRMINNTLADNQLANGIFDVDSQVNALIANSIIHETTAVPILEASAGGSVPGLQFDCMLVHESDSFSGNQIVVGDPGFIDRDEGNFHLGLDSTATDMCSNNLAKAAELDIDATPRGWDDPMNTNLHGPYDVGADEMRFDIQTDLYLKGVNLLTSAPYNAGQIVTYNVVLINTGPDIPAETTLSGQLKNLKITSVASTHCNSLPCIIDNMPVGYTEKLTFSAMIIAPGEFDNIMMVNSTAVDPNPSNNIDFMFNGGITEIVDLIFTSSFE